MQPNIISSASDSEVLLPINDKQWQIIRDKAAAGNGKYYGYNENGVKELIGGGPQSQISVSIQYNQLTNTLSSTVSGGTASQYEWGVSSYNDSPLPGVGGIVPPSYSSANGNPTITINGAAGSTVMGMVSLKVTDTLGRIAYNNFWILLVPQA